MSSSQEKEKGVNVQVLLRCRPFSEDELRSNVSQVVTCNEYNREVAVSVAGKHRVFTFDKVFGPASQQTDLYDQTVSPLIYEVLEGFNSTILAYGQTGTGKTYTMEGKWKSSKSGPNGEFPVGAGVIPRAVKQIFDSLERQNAEYSVKVTYLELYNEEISDLLAPKGQKKQLSLMEDGKGGVHVRGLVEDNVTSASEIFTLLEKGSAKRRTAETLLNKRSSRSHSVFSIMFHIKEATSEGEGLTKYGKLNLVDLAGSENISRSGAKEGHAREAGEINRSLLTLGRVINALVENLGHVPYRDSKLTRILRDSLGGRTKTCIIATISPGVHCLEETLSTLDYAHRAKNIKNMPEVNQKMLKSTRIEIPLEELECLKSENKAMADQIEQMGLTIKTLQKQLEDLQSKSVNQVGKCPDLSNKLDTTEAMADQNEQMGNMVETLQKEDEDLHAQGRGARIFVNGLPQRATTDHLRQYFEKYGRVVDVYMPKAAIRSHHRGYGFVTFAEERAAHSVRQVPHVILGHEVIVDKAIPRDDAGPSGNIYRGDRIARRRLDDHRHRPY